MNSKQLLIDTELVQRLVEAQFPQWQNLPIRPVASSGWDNRTFHLGHNMLVRMPSAAEYELQVAKEHRWLPKLAPLLPLSIPEPLVIGEPDFDYPWKWSIYRWLDGDTAASAHIKDLNDFANKLAEFLSALQKIDSTGGPVAGQHSFYRGGALSTYDNETRQAIHVLKDRIDVKTTNLIWETALANPWQHAPVWAHGDIAPGNLLVLNGQLSAIIDFGQLAIGDPACDLAIAWTFFKGQSRDVFHATLKLDDATWARGRAWALWKALIICSARAGTNQRETEKSWLVITEIVNEYKK